MGSARMGRIPRRGALQGAVLAPRAPVGQHRRAYIRGLNTHARRARGLALAAPRVGQRSLSEPRGQEPSRLA